MGAASSSTGSAGATEQHVFVSYSRKDSEIARRLTTALEDAGRRAWLDLEGIPLSAEWLAEINRAIDAAEACVFILSPDWVTSEICRAELRHAVERNKRLIPLLHRDVGAEAPEELAKLNWLFARPEDDLEATVAALVETIDTDLEHVRTHTRLLVKADEWRTHFEEPSRLLRGKNLREAAEWLETAAAKEPAATELHLEYVGRSRALARRRRRQAVGGLLLTGLLALAGSLVAVHTNQRSVAVAKARQGLEVVSNQPADALVFAIQAAGATRLDRARVSSLRALGVGAERDLAPEVRSALFAGYQNLAGGTVERALIDTPDSRPVQTVRFAPDGETVICGSDAGNVQVWRLDGTLISQTEPGAKVIALDVSRDGKLVAGGGDDSRVRVWTLGEDGSLTERAGVGAGSIVRSVAFSPTDDGLVAIGNNSGQVLLWRWREGGGVASPRTSSGDEIKAVAFSPDGRTVASTSGPSLVRFFDLEAREIPATWRLADGGEAPPSMLQTMAVAFSPDGDRLATGGGGDGVMRIWTRGEERDRWILGAEALGHSLPVTSAAFTPDGKSLVSGSFDGTVRHWDLLGRPLRRPFPAQEAVPSVAVSPDGKTVVSAGWAANLRLWTLTDEPPGRVIGRHGAYAERAPEGTDLAIYRKVNSVDIDADGDTIVSGGHDGLLRLWDRSGKLLDEAPDGTLELPPSFKGELRVQSVAISGDGRTVVRAGWDRAVKQWQLAAEGLVGERNLVEEFGLPRSVDISADGRTVVAGGGKVTRGALAWRDGEPLVLEGFESFEERGEPRVAVSADGGTIVSTRGAEQSGPVQLWREPWGAPITLAESTFGISANALATSATGRTIALADQSAFVRLWAADGATLGDELTGHFGAVYSAAVSADGELVASGGGGDGIRLWDRQGHPLGVPLEAHDGLVSSLAMSADGQTLASGGWDGSVRLWPLGEVEEWLAAACAWLRNYDGIEQMEAEVEAARAVCEPVHDAAG